jgi:UPF0271 protein
VNIDLNSDVGEGFGTWQLGDDAGMLELISSANVACGFHAGDATIMRRVCALAAERGVAIGAQVGYRDLAGFGRRFIDIEPDQLSNDILYQISALDGIARAEGSAISYVKPHGALYNAIVSHEAQAAAVVAAVAAARPGCPVYGLPGSVFLRLAAEAGLHPVPEAFADRAYTAHGALVSRRLPGAVLHDPDAIAARVVSMVVQGEVVTQDGATISLAPQSICVHGDTPGAVAIARTIRAALQLHGIDIRAAA